MRWISAVGIAVLLSLLVRAAAVATTVEEIGLDVQAREATTIFRGRVTSVEELLLAGRHGPVPITRVSVHVTDWLKGRSRPVVTFTLPGGRAPGGRQLVLDGAPTFQEGQDVCLLLVEDRGLLVPIVGFHQGCYRVRGERVFQASGRAVVNVDGSGRVQAGLRSDDALSWTQFRFILAAFAKGR